MKWGGPSIWIVDDSYQFLWLITLCLNQGSNTSFATFLCIPHSLLYCWLYKSIFSITSCRPHFIWLVSCFLVPPIAWFLQLWNGMLHTQVLRNIFTVSRFSSGSNMLVICMQYLPVKFYLNNWTATIKLLLRFNNLGI